MPPGATPITPSPAHMSQMGKSTGHRRWGSTLLILIVAAFAVSAFLNNWSARVQGSVTVIVRGADNVRTLNTLDLASGYLTSVPSIDPNSITTISSRTFRMADGSVITLDSAGVVRRPQGGNLSVLVASPVAPLLRTPLSVWGDAERIAWVSPADASIQVFYRSARGAYLPAYLNIDIHPNSLGFTEDGTYLVATSIVHDNNTDVYAINIGTGKIIKIATLDGLAFITPTP